jgi:hypothetical protein
VFRDPGRPSPTCCCLPAPSQIPKLLQHLPIPLLQPFGLRLTPPAQTLFTVSHPSNSPCPTFCAPLRSIALSHHCLPLPKRVEAHITSFRAHRCTLRLSNTQPSGAYHYATAIRSVRWRRPAASIATLATQTTVVQRIPTTTSYQRTTIPTLVQLSRPPSHPRRSWCRPI